MADLILIPTALERRQVEPTIHPLVRSSVRPWIVDLCGFGLVAAAASAARLIAEHQPERVLLIGIAGSLSERCQVGSAYRFSNVICDGIGVGSGEHFQSASSLGWNFRDAGGGTEAISDSIRLTNWASTADFQPNGSRDDSPLTLLGVGAAAANAGEAGRRKQLHPSAVAEDMESFSVAFACRVAGCSLEIVRGISNHAGDRRKEHWQIENALEAAAAFATELLGG